MLRELLELGVEQRATPGSALGHRVQLGEPVVRREADVVVDECVRREHADGEHGGQPECLDPGAAGLQRKWAEGRHQKHRR